MPLVRHTARRSPASAEPAPPQRVDAPAPPVHAALLRDSRVSLFQRQALAARVAGGHGNARLARAVLARSPVSDELAVVWTVEGKAEFFERLRHLEVCDQDLLAFVERELVGDDLWLARNLLLHGPECGWPIELRVERELKGWDDCRGVAGAFELLRAASGTEAGNAELTATLARVITNPDTLWMAQQLQTYGPEGSWPPDVRSQLAAHRRAAVVTEMKATIDKEATWTVSEGKSARDGAPPSTFAAWAEAESEAAAPKVSPETTLNCWEMILLAAYNSGSLGWKPIHDVYLTRPPGEGSDEANWEAFLASKFLPRKAIEFRRDDPGGPQPAAGDIVLFDGVEHVALATGEHDQTGTYVLSFWPPKDTGSVETARGTIGSTQRTTIEALALELDPTAEDQRQLAQDDTVVRFGRPPW